METLIPQVDPAKLRQTRLAAKKTMQQMGVALSVTMKQIGNIESGLSNISGDDLALWARECDVTDLRTFYTDAPPNAFVQRKKRGEKSPIILS